MRTLPLRKTGFAPFHCRVQDQGNKKMLPTHLAVNKNLQHIVGRVILVYSMFWEAVHTVKESANDCYPTKGSCFRRYRKREVVRLGEING